MQDRLRFALISLQASSDDGLVGIIEPVVFERAFPKPLDQLVMVGTGKMKHFDLDQRFH